MKFGITATVSGGGGTHVRRLLTKKFRSRRAAKQRVAFINSDIFSVRNPRIVKIRRRK